MNKCAQMTPNVYTCLLVSLFFRVGLSRREVEMGTLPPEDIYVNKDAGETGRYYVTLESGDRYLCRYGNASASLIDSPAFSEECYYQNKDVLTDIEKNAGLFPYYHSVNLKLPGCGSLPNVTGAGDKWACPRGVSPLSVPVYESCHLQCSSGASIKVRCTEKLEFDSLASHKCPIESTSQTEKAIETSRIYFSIASTLPLTGETRTEEKIETSRNFLFDANTVSSAVETQTEKVTETSRIFFSVASTLPSTVENSSGESPEISSSSLVTIVVPLAIVLLMIILVISFLLRRNLVTRRIFQKGLFKDAVIDVDQGSNFADMNSAGGSSSNNEGTVCLIKKNTRPVLYGNEDNARVEINNLTQVDLDSDNSETGNDRSGSAFFQRTKSSSNKHGSFKEARHEYFSARRENCESDSVNNLLEGRGESRHISSLSSSTSDKNIYPLDLSSLKREDAGDIREDVAFIEWHPPKDNYAEPAFLPVESPEKSPSVSCPTISAMLEGAMDNSVHFVDDLSTLLDLDVQYKNPRNWQGLAQAFLGLSYNKIMEIRHKTKDHFKEGILPLLSSYGYTVYDVTNYFSLLPSRRVDVIECIQRYHPNCQKCGEIYNSLKSNLLLNAS